jgi:hypothetical protein
MFFVVNKKTIHQLHYSLPGNGVVIIRSKDGRQQEFDVRDLEALADFLEKEIQNVRKVGTVDEYRGGLVL